jgi:Tfp pilus tip-associated adhesin PilY1
MLHAIDARLGIEVWAFIPFNLLPKLRALNDGVSIGKFDYLFDGSPKVADVKIDDAWRTMLVVGQGRGGTFYQAFDVTLPGIEETVDPTEDTITDALSYFSSSSRVTLSWAFPRYSAFDYTVQTTAAPYGDLGASATATERTVGQTWSDPAVGQAVNASGKYVVITGSGFLPYSQQTGALRGGTSAPVAGATLYMLNAEDGTVYASQSVGSDGLAETVDDCAVANNCQVMKNALHADPVATGPPDSRYITKVYIGDLDGRVWRFNIGTSSGAPVFTSYLNLFNASLVNGHGNAKKANSTQPLFSSMATVTVGVTQQYIFFGTGSDLLPSNGVTQAYQLIGFLDNGTTGVQTFAKDLSTVNNKTGNEEKVTAFPAVAGDIVFFTTTTFRPANPCLTSDANLYALTYTGGAAYDTNSDGRLSSQDSIKVTTVAGARATAPFVVDQHLVVGAGNMVEVFGDAADYNNGVGQVGVRILTWREVR